MRTRLSAVLLLVLSGCGGGGDEAKEPRALRAERLAEAPNAASGWLSESVSYRVPHHVQSMTLFGERLAWGAVEAGADPSALPRVVEVLDLRSGELLERPLDDDAAAVTALAGTGDWLITRETIEKPLSECEQRGTGCFAWSLWAEDLRDLDADRVSLARGGPAPQEALPIPVADAGQVVWQEAQGPKSVQLHIKSLVARAEEQKVPISALTYDISLSQGTTVWSDVDGGSYALDPDADTPRRVQTVPVLHSAAGAGFVSTVKRTKPDSADTAVQLQPLGGASKASVVYKGEDIYRSRPVTPGVVLVEDYLGLHLAKAAPGTAKVTLASADLDPLARTSVDAGRVAYATSSPAGDKPPIVHVVRPRAG